MIKPSDIEDLTWDVIMAANDGNAVAMRDLLAADPDRSREGYFYTPPIHFAVREGHLDVVRLLLEAGADPEWNGHYGLSLIEMARERGHEAVAILLEKARDQRGRTAPAPTRDDHDIHRAADAGDVRRVRELLNADATLLNRGDRAGGTPGPALPDSERGLRSRPRSAELARGERGGRPRGFHVYRFQ